MYFAYLELLNFFPPPPADVDCVTLGFTHITSKVIKTQ